MYTTVVSTSCLHDELVYVHTCYVSRGVYLYTKREQFQIINTNLAPWKDLH